MSKISKLIGYFEDIQEFLVSKVKSERNLEKSNTIEISSLENEDELDSLEIIPQNSEKRFRTPSFGTFQSIRSNNDTNKNNTVNEERFNLDIENKSNFKNESQLDTETADTALRLGSTQNVYGENPPSQTIQSLKTTQKSKDLDDKQITISLPISYPDEKIYNQHDILNQNNAIADSLARGETLKRTIKKVQKKCHVNLENIIKDGKRTQSDNLDLIKFPDGNESSKTIIENHVKSFPDLSVTGGTLKRKINKIQKKCNLDVENATGCQTKQDENQGKLSLECFSDEKHCILENQPTYDKTLSDTIGADVDKMRKKEEWIKVRVTCGEQFFALDEGEKDILIGSCGDQSQELWTSANESRDMKDKIKRNDKNNERHVENEEGRKFRDHKHCTQENLTNMNDRNNLNDELPHDDENDGKIVRHTSAPTLRKKDDSRRKSSLPEKGDKKILLRKKAISFECDLDPAFPSLERDMKGYIEYFSSW